MSDRPSRCSAGKTLDFAFYPDAPAPTTAAIQAATEAFTRVMQRPGLLWSPYSWPLERRRFTRLLEQACIGALVPVDHVKDIDRGAHEYLFEIRWTIGVLEQGEDGSRRQSSVQVRLYHAEPANAIDIFVGLHLHEKRIVEGDPDATTTLQNHHIDIAIAKFHRGRSTRWGIV